MSFLESGSFIRYVQPGNKNNSLPLTSDDRGRTKPIFHPDQYMVSQPDQDRQASLAGQIPVIP